MDPDGPSPSANSRSWTWLDLGIAVGLVVLSLIRLGPAIDDVSFHRDEARWIGNSALLREWRHPLGIEWQDEGYPSRYGSLDESVRRRSQPPLAMYVIGLGLIVQGEGLPDLGYWIMNFDNEWNTERGAVRLGIPRRLDGIARIEIHHARAFGSHRDTNWGLEAIR